MFILVPRVSCSTVQVTCLDFSLELPGQLVSLSSSQCTRLPPCPDEQRGTGPSYA